MSMSTAAPATAAPTRRSPWFRSAPFDLLLILGVPFLTWPLLTAARMNWGADLLTKLILLTATGHYMATFVRAYGDQELFARFRVRFVVAPIVLLVTCVGLYTNGQGPQLMILVAAWAFWHWLAQAFGFARIYDIKVGSFHWLTALLDKALVITGFIAAVTLNDGAIATFGKLFLSAGVPLPSGATVNTVQAIVTGLCIVVGTAYVANLVITIVRGKPWSWQKQFMHVTTIGYYWFAFTWLPNVLIAHVLYEFFHDVQYFAITWITCKSRVQRPGVTTWLKRMFAPTKFAAVCFLVAMVSFGALDAFGRHSLTDGELGERIWMGVFLTAALLHYYYDGFIWKAREQVLGDDLGIASGMRAAVVPGMRHAAAWSAFFVPLIALLTLDGLNQKFTEKERAEALVAVAPDDFYSLQSLSFILAGEGDLPTALAHYQRSVELHSEFAPSRVNYGAALELHGDLDAAIEQYRACLECPGKDGAHGQASVNLGVLLLLRDQRDEAMQYFQRAQALGAEEPVHRLLAMGAGLPASARERRCAYYEAALKLQPAQQDALLSLGFVKIEMRQFDAATKHLTAFCNLVPSYVPGLLGLSDAHFESGRKDQARTILRRALALEPQNQHAMRLRAKFGMR